MPEGLEAELYRRSAGRCVGRTIDVVTIDDRQATADEIRAALPGCAIVGVRRIGKLVLLDTSRSGVPGPTLALHFGMTGRLIVDGEAPIARLEYGSSRDDPAWDRLIVTFEGGGELRVNDPRRWASFVLDSDEGRLGPDFLAVDIEHLEVAFGRRRAALKAVLLDQTVVAGLGNLCVDEVLWQAGLSPLTSVQLLGHEAIVSLVRVMRSHLPAMLALGGSHRGTIDPVVRARLPPCPRDGEPLRRANVAGRTTVWCPAHQLVGH